MSQTVKRIIGILFVVLSVAVVIFIAFSNTEMKDAWAAISRMDLRWLAGIFLCWVVYVVFEATGTWAYLRGQKFRVHLPRIIGSTLIGFYYSNITPSAAGGQPMQVNSLRKAGIPVGYGTLAVTIRLVMNQFMVCMISLVLLLMNRTFVYQQLGGVMWFVRVGWAINFVVAPLVVLAAFRRNWIQKIGEKLIGLLARIHLVKDPENTIRKMTEVLDTYQEALKALMHSPGQILLQVLCSTISLLGLLGTVVFTYYAFGQSGTPWYRILTLSSLLYISASYTPLPGASGAQEGGFLVYFANIFKDGTIGLALLTWRFFTYYLFLIVGMFTVINEKLLLHREKRRKRKEQKEQQAEPREEDSDHGE